MVTETLRAVGQLFQHGVKIGEQAKAVALKLMYKISQKKFQRATEATSDFDGNYPN